MADEAPPGPEGAGIVTLSLAGTAAVMATSAASAAAPDAVGSVHAVLSLVLFAVGTGAMLWAYGLGVSRSRVDQIDIPGLFWLSGAVAPPDTRRRLRGAVVVQVVVVVAAASIRPFSEVAFGILAPMYGLGLMALWSGRYGAFPPRSPTVAA
jgi:hypothetical protein